jgi:hypothetical protein
MAFYEYRVYDVAPGKMAAVHKRFAEPGVRLLTKHGFKIIGIWQTSVGVGNQLHEVFEWPDYETRAKAGAAMVADEEWLRATEEAERDGPLILRTRNEIWMATPYSPTQAG